MQASLEQLRQCHCHSMKSTSKTEQSSIPRHWQTLVEEEYRIGFGVIGIFPTNVSNRNLVVLIQVDGIKKKK